MASGCFELVPGVVWQSVDDGVMLLDVAKGQYYELNPSGARMFELVLNQPSLDNVERELLAEFRVGSEQIKPDLLELLQTLLEANLIRPVQSAESPP